MVIVLHNVQVEQRGTSRINFHCLLYWIKLLTCIGPKRDIYTSDNNIRAPKGIENFNGEEEFEEITA